MSTLVAYGSSDEEDNVFPSPPNAPTPNHPESSSDAGRDRSNNLQPNGTNARAHIAPPAQSSDSLPDSSQPPSDGPILGPKAPSLSTFAPDISAQEDSDEPSESSSISLVHSLTMPPIPNLSPLPPSPSTTPPPSPVANKIAHFLHLKRTQSEHFNARLATSSAANNPALFAKLMEYAGLDPEGPEQYATTLPKDAWDPVGTLPKWAYKEELAKVMEKERSRREKKATEEGRDRVEFVSAKAKDKIGGGGDREGDSREAKRRK